MIYLIKTNNIADFKIIYKYISLLKSSTIIINLLGKRNKDYKFLYYQKHNDSIIPSNLHSNKSYKT